MDSDQIHKLTSIIHRAFLSKPITIEFEELENGKSFWSLIYRVYLTWHNNAPLDECDQYGRLIYPKRVFIKLPVITKNALRSEPDAEDELWETLRRLTNTEITFYECFGNKDLGLYRIPKIYLAEPVKARGTGAYVFEDMSLTDGDVFSEDYIPGYSVEQVLKLVDALAVFHSYLLSSQGTTWVTKFPREVNISFQELMQQVSGEFEKWAPETFSGKWGKIKDIFSIDNVKDINDCYNSTGLPFVLVHNDLNPTNVLWKKVGGVKEVSAILDFQMINIGSICEDIGRVLTLGLSPDDRRKNTKSVLQAYHTKMTALNNGNPPFTLEQVEEEYKRVFNYVCNFTLFGIACYYGQCIDPENAAKVDPSVTRELKEAYLFRASQIMDDIISGEPI